VRYAGLLLQGSLPGTLAICGYGALTLVRYPDECLCHDQYQRIAEVVTTARWCKQSYSLQVLVDASAAVPVSLSQMASALSSISANVSTATGASVASVRPILPLCQLQFHLDELFSLTTIGARRCQLVCSQSLCEMGCSRTCCSQVSAGVATVCGNGVCESGEADTCAADCPQLKTCPLSASSSAGGAQAACGGHGACSAVLGTCECFTGAHCSS
jgi:hypothetical protein